MGQATAPPNQVERARRLLERSRRAVLRARAVTITAQYLLQSAQATRYENRLIRGLERQPPIMG